MLKLLQEAEALLHCGDFLLSEGQACARDCKETVETIFSFLLWDCMAQVLEVPISEPGRTALEYVAELRIGGIVEVSLLQELEECLRDGGAEALGQSVRVLAQILRDLHPVQDCFHLTLPQNGKYSCRPWKIHRITCFRGLLARVIRKAGGDSGFSLTTAVFDPDVHRGVCVRVGRLLERVWPEGGSTELQGDTETITQYLKLTLAKEAFNPEAFDAGVKHRLLGILEFSPARLALKSLMQIHLDTLVGFEHYLQKGEHHSFKSAVESVQMLGGSQLCCVEYVRGPIAIDNGMEEVYSFVTSEPTSFLARICCHGYERESLFEVREPRCISLSQPDWETLEGVQGFTGGTVLAKEGGTVWVREGGGGWMSKLQVEVQRHNLQLNDQGCCFKITSHRSECEVKFIYKNGRISAHSVSNCDIL